MKKVEYRGSSAFKSINNHYISDLQKMDSID